MCLIIDANVAADLQPPSADARPVVNAVERRKITLVTGGKNTEELSRAGAVRRWLAGLVRANLARPIPAADIEREESILPTLGRLRSDDPHVVALARASGARLLFSKDKALAQDFKNREFVSEPTGSVYKGRAHTRLLNRAVCRGN